MEAEEFEKLSGLVEKKNTLIRKIQSLDLYKKPNDYMFHHIGNALYKETKGKEPDSIFAEICIKHKEELYSFIQKIIDEEEIKLNIEINSISLELKKISIDFGESNGKEESHNEN